ncbi:MAG: hypothetical protein WD557_16200 [Dehalococcoidia bacterium]
MQLSLTNDETALFRNILDRQLSLLREEVGKTENYQMRQDLKADEALLKGLIARIHAAAA